MAIKALWQTDRDTIGRQAAIDGKIWVQRTNGAEIYSDEVVPVEYLKMLPSTQPEPCADTVSRTAAIEEQERIMSDHPLDGYEDGRLLINALKALPSAQPEIIRCKDCKYHRQNDYGDSWCSHPKGLDEFDLKPTDFCSRAERRTDGTEQP